MLCTEETADASTFVRARNPDLSECVGTRLNNGFPFKDGPGRPEAHPDGAADSPPVVGQQGWEKYLVAGGKDFWWYCNNGGEWFLEASPGPWAKYFDPASKKYYWQRDEETFFWAS